MSDKKDIADQKDGAAKIAPLETDDKLSAAPAGGAGQPSKRKNSRGFPTEEIPPRPTQVTRLTRERAHMLATLPRSKISDMFWPAITGVSGATPGAWITFHTVYLDIINGIAVKQQDFVDFLIGFSFFAVFIALFAVSIVAGWNTQTSKELLDGIYPADVQKFPLRLRIAKQIL